MTNVSSNISEIDSIHKKTWFSQLGWGGVWATTSTPPHTGLSHP